MRGLLAPLIKLIAFLLVTSAATYVLAATIANQSFGDTRSYHALFTDVTGLQEGDDVRIAGVRVGTIDAIDIIKGNANTQSIAKVTFEVAKSRPLPKDVEARIRYRNLVGQRYLDIEQGPGTNPAIMKSGDTIPLDQTHNAVDLTVLFGGFAPLTQGLQADQINQLSLELVQTLQGEGGALQLLLTNLASLTNSLADKDQVIGDVIDNLNEVLTTVAARDNELTDLIIQLRSFVSGLAADRVTIGNAIVGINNLATSTSGLLEQVRPPLAADVKSITALAANLNRNGKTLTYVLQQLPPTAAGLIRTAQYGSWFNFYLCNVSGTLTLPGGAKTNLQFVANHDAGGRCD